MGRRRYFTLIELFLAISILALLGSIVLVNAKPMLDHYRFSRNISHLKQEIDFTRRLSRTAHADIEFHIEQKKEGLLCRRKTDEPLSLPRTFDVLLSIPHLKLEEKEVLLSFTASGWIKEEKEFTVHFKDKTETLTFLNYIKKS